MQDPSEPSADYPLGGLVEPYDIARDEELTRAPRCASCDDTGVIVTRHSGGEHGVPRAIICHH